MGLDVALAGRGWRRGAGATAGLRKPANLPMRRAVWIALRGRPTIGSYGVFARTPGSGCSGSRTERWPSPWSARAGRPLAG